MLPGRQTSDRSVDARGFGCFSAYTRVSSKHPSRHPSAAAVSLTGARRRPAADLAAAAAALATLSRLAAAHPELSEIEINPLPATPGAAIALDARFARASTQEEESNRWTSPTPPRNSSCETAPAA